jgi:2'-5' RNA ligase
VRLFVALRIPEDMRKVIAELIRELKPADESWKWTRPENLHITLKFLGETPVDQLNSVEEALRKVHGDLPMELTFRGLGLFPDERRPRVLWAGIEAPPNLPAMAASVGESLAGIGVPPEQKLFSPHLTLARSKTGSITPKLREAIAEYSTREFGRVKASTFHLIESRLKTAGAEYTTLRSFPDAAED